MFSSNEKEPILALYEKKFDPRIAYAVGNSDIGLLFGQRVKPNMLWKMRVNGKDEITLHDELGIIHVLGVVENVKRLSFTFDNFSYPIVAVEVDTGIEVYKFNGSEGKVADKELIITLPNCYYPELIPSNISDLGSINNQPILFCVDNTGSIFTRSLKDNFATKSPDPVLTNLLPTDILSEVSITQNGRIQLGISKLKIES